MNVEVKELPERRVPHMRNIGPMGDPGIDKMWARFAAWCSAHGLFDGKHEFVGVSKDSPDITAPEKTRYDACVEVAATFQPEGEVNVQIVPGGRYACISFTGRGDEIHAAWMHFYGEWLPASPWQADHRPPLELYGTDTNVDPKTGVFTCQTGDAGATALGLAPRRNGKLRPWSRIAAQQKDDPYGTRSIRW